MSELAAPIGDSGMARELERDWRWPEGRVPRRSKRKPRYRKDGQLSNAVKSVGETGRIQRRRRDAKLTAEQIAAAHKLYAGAGLSLRELGRRLYERYGYSSSAACANALHKAFRLEGLGLRDRIEATRQASTIHGLRRRGTHDPRYLELRRRRRRERGEVEDRPCAGVRLRYPRKGEPCGRPALRGSDYCFSHDPARDEERRRRLAAARARVGQAGHPMEAAA